MFHHVSPVSLVDIADCVTRHPTSVERARSTSARVGWRGPCIALKTTLPRNHVSFRATYQVLNTNYQLLNHQLNSITKLLTVLPPCLRLHAAVTTAPVPFAIADAALRTP